jgi:hypothetical protein
MFYKVLNLVIIQKPKTMNYKTLLLTVAVIFATSTSFISKPVENKESKKKLLCTAYIADAENVSFTATIDNIVGFTCGGVHNYGAPIGPASSVTLSGIIPDCISPTFLIRTTGPFTSISLIDVNTGFIYDQMNYDPLGNGTYTLSLPFTCVITYDIVLQ